MSDALEAKVGDEVRRWKPYPAYKRSGVEWLGEIPEHWEVGRVGSHARLINGFPFESEYFNRQEGTPLVRIRDLTADSTEVFYQGPNVEKARISQGDLLVGMDGDFNVSRWEGGDAVLNQRVCSLRVGNRLDQRFLAYALPIPLKRINDMSHATTVRHLSSHQIRKVNLGLPGLGEQRKVADFLDRETVRIDSLVWQKRRIVELLRELARREASEHALRGLEPSRPSSDSGIEWLGEIPSHWAVARVGVLFSERDERREPDLPLLEVSLNTGVRIREFSTDHIERLAADLGTLKVARAGDLVFNKMRMWQGAVGVAPKDGLVSSDYTVAKPADGILSRYFVLVFRTERCKVEINKFSHGIVPDRNRLYWDGFKQIHCPLPPQGEQAAIVDWVGHRTAEISSVQTKVRQGVERLKEYRHALISAAVTGKIDVRGAA